MTGDEGVVAQLRSGDSRAFSAVFAEHNGRLFRFLTHLTGRRDVAEDLLQDTWLRLARAAPRLTPDTRLVPWLFTVARNAFISHRRWALLDMSRLLAARSLPEKVTLPVDLDDARRVRKLERALQGLSTSNREVLLLVAVEGLEQEDAAKVLGVRYDTLRQRLTRARAALAREMEKTA